MKLKALVIPALTALGLAVARPGRRAGEAHRLVGQGLLQGGGRRAVRRHQEVRGQAQEREDRAVAVPGAGHDPEDRVGARLRQPARRGLCRRLRLPGHGQVGLRRQAGRHQQRDLADAGALRAQHGRDHLPLQRPDQVQGLLRLPDQAADDAHRVLDRHADRGGLQGVRHPDHLEGVLVLLVREGAAGQPAEERQAHLRHRHADGRGFERLLLFLPDLHGRLQRASWSTTAASCWSTIRRCAPA